jgi:hypothetical protein
MTTAEDRKNYFGELKIHMSKVINAYDKWKSTLDPGTPEQLVLTKLKERHDEYQIVYLQSDPVDDEGMERKANAMRTYLDVTVVHIDQLSSAGKTVVGKKETQKVEYADILAARSNLENLSEKVLNAVKSQTGVASTPGGQGIVTNGSKPLVVTDSNTEQLSDDNLFVDMLESQPVQNEINKQLGPNSGTSILKQTKDIFAGRVSDPALTDADITNLVTSWQIVVTFFAGQDLFKPPGSFAAIAGLIEIHSLLEILYDQLLPNVEQTSTESLDSRILSIY